MKKDYTEDSCSKSPNTSVKCTVNECTNHCQDKDYCSLDAVQIGTHESHPTEKQCVDCNSFEAK